MSSRSTTEAICLPQGTKTKKRYMGFIDLEKHMIECQDKCCVRLVEILIRNGRNLNRVTEK